jgi:uncharacterized membrane protein YtjA (UPF0391 family)
MSKKTRLLLSYAFLLSIILLVTGFLGVGIRAFASSGISNAIFTLAFGILIVTLPIYFVLRRPFVGRAKNQKIWRPLPVRHVGPGTGLPLQRVGRKDRRIPLPQGQERAAVAIERWTKQGAGFEVVTTKPIAGETLRG